MSEESKIQIKYEKLSSEIKDEISKYHNSCLSEGIDRPFDESMHCWFDEKLDSWFIKRFGDSEKSRKSHRVDVELPVKIVDTLASADEGSDSELDLVGTVVNISKGGLYFRSIKPIEESNVIKVIVDMSKVEDEIPQIEAIAMVIRCEHLDTDEFGIGLMFSSIYQDDRESLNMFIFKNLSYYLYNK
jgi:hypothetical protein